MIDTREKAGELYCGNFNCAQAVLCAFNPHTGLSDEHALKLAASFGGGMGNLKEVCGALTGAFMVGGLLKGFTVATGDNKRAHNLVVQAMADKFKEKFGSIHCRDLLQRNIDDGSHATEAKPCLKYVLYAVDISNELLESCRKDV